MFPPRYTRPRSPELDRACRAQPRVGSYASGDRLGSVRVHPRCAGSPPTWPLVAAARPRVASPRWSRSRCRSQARPRAATAGRGLRRGVGVDPEAPDGRLITAYELEQERRRRDTVARCRGSIGTAGAWSNTLRLDPVRPALLQGRVDAHGQQARALGRRSKRCGDEGVQRHRARRRHRCARRREGVRVRARRRHLPAASFDDNGVGTPGDAARVTLDAQNKKSGTGPVMTDSDDHWDLAVRDYLSPDQRVGGGRPHLRRCRRRLLREHVRPELHRRPGTRDQVRRALLAPLLQRLLERRTDDLRRRRQQGLPAPVGRARRGRARADARCHRVHVRAWSTRTSPGRSTRRSATSWATRSSCRTPA